MTAPPISPSPRTRQTTAPAVLAGRLSRTGRSRVVISVGVSGGAPANGRGGAACDVHGQGLPGALVTPCPPVPPVTPVAGPPAGGTGAGLTGTGAVGTGGGAGAAGTGGAAAAGAVRGSVAAPGAEGAAPGAEGTPPIRGGVRGRGGISPAPRGGAGGAGGRLRLSGDEAGDGAGGCGEDDAEGWGAWGAPASGAVGSAGRCARVAGAERGRTGAEAERESGAGGGASRMPERGARPPGSSVPGTGAPGSPPAPGGTDGRACRPAALPGSPVPGTGAPGLRPAAPGSDGRGRRRGSEPEAGPVERADPEAGPVERAEPVPEPPNSLVARAGSFAARAGSSAARAGDIERAWPVVAAVREPGAAAEGVSGDAVRGRGAGGTESARGSGVESVIGRRRVVVSVGAGAGTCGAWGGREGMRGRCASVLIRPPFPGARSAAGSPFGAGPFAAAPPHSTGWSAPEGNGDRGSGGICAERPPTLG